MVERVPTAHVALALLVTVIWGVAFVATRLALDDFSPAALTALRFLVAAGPAANFLLSIALFSLLFGAFGEPIVSTRVSELVPGESGNGTGGVGGEIACIGHLTGHASLQPN